MRTKDKIKYTKFKKIPLTQYTKCITLNCAISTNVDKIDKNVLTIIIIIIRIISKENVRSC